MCLLSLRRLSRLLAAACSHGSQPLSEGQVLPGCPKPRPPSSPWKNGGLALCCSLPDSAVSLLLSNAYTPRHTDYLDTDRDSYREIPLRPQTPRPERERHRASALPQVHLRPAVRRKPLNRASFFFSSSLPEAVPSLPCLCQKPFTHLPRLSRVLAAITRSRMRQSSLTRSRRHRQGSADKAQHF